ncbi:MAG: NAD-dependent epimerase/dehydratase family protein [Planctomycetaceae bacterium]|nr:NAD-dependent epimerase/dehydratase family protein [Planctomycetaceae bacterium]
MRIFVTGGAGFIGSHLCRAAVAEGHAVDVMDNLSTGSRDNVADLIPNPIFQLIIADGSDQSLVNSLVSKADAVVHLAAAVGVQLVIDDPVRTLETNIDVTQGVLKACRDLGKRVLIASSSEVYGRGSQEWFRETDDLVIGPPTSRRWGYAASKLVDEFLALAYHYEHELPVTVLRLFNTVGPGQVGHYGMVIPRFVRRALLGEAITVYGDGEQRRTFTGVDQVVKAILQLIECRESIGKIVNVGGTAETSINDLASAVIRATKSKSVIEHIPYEKAYGESFEDMRRRNPDTKALKDLLGWAPHSDLNAILGPVIEDMRKRLKKEGVLS